MKIALLNRNGYRISQLSAMSPQQLEHKLGSLRGEEEQQLCMVDALLFSMYEIDVQRFDEVLDAGFSQWTPLQMISQVIYPFLNKTGLLLQGSRESYEHIAVTSIRKKLIWAIENTKVTPGGSEVMLFLPCTRQLDLGLLYMYYHLRQQSVKVCYLGNDVSLSNLEFVFGKCRPRLVYTYLHPKNDFNVDVLGSILKRILPQSRLVFTMQHPKAFRNLHQNLFHFQFDEALSFLLQQCAAE